MCPDSQNKDPGPPGALDRRKLVVMMQVLSLVSEENGLAKTI